MLLQREPFACTLADLRLLPPLTDFESDPAVAEVRWGMLLS
jgi:hypothetical protein